MLTALNLPDNGFGCQSGWERGTCMRISVLYFMYAEALRLTDSTNGLNYAPSSTNFKSKQTKVQILGGWKWRSELKNVTAPEVPLSAKRNGSYIEIIQWYRIITTLNYHLQIQANFRHKNTPENLIKIQQQFNNDEEKDDRDDSEDNLGWNLCLTLLITLCVAFLHISNCSEFFHLKAVYVWQYKVILFVYVYGVSMWSVIRFKFSGLWHRTPCI
jgi:hypothetical protein